MCSMLLYSEMKHIGKAQRMAIGLWILTNALLSFLETGTRTAFFLVQEIFCLENKINIRKIVRNLRTTFTINLGIRLNPTDFIGRIHLMAKVISKKTWRWISLHFESTDCVLIMNYFNNNFFSSLLLRANSAAGPSRTVSKIRQTNENLKETTQRCRTDTDT
jgi:hypothetical protein